MSRLAQPAFLPVCASVCIAWFSGCTVVGPDFELPNDPTEPVWYQEERAGLVATESELVDWWKQFGDPRLDRLVEIAHAENNNLEIAALRVLEARAQLGIATGLQWPQSQVATGDVGYTSPSESGGPAEDFWSASLGASVAWEIDFWGRYQRQIESAGAALQSAMASYDDVLVLLTAQVVEIYTVIRLTREQLRIASQNIEIQQRSYQIVEVLTRFGDQAALDLQQALTLLLGTQATVPNLEANLQQAKNALATLLGRPPSDLEVLLAGDAGLPAIPERIAVGIPADLLRRRPDVRVAEMNAMAQNALVGVARADLYPSFSLAGFFGLSARGGNFFSVESLTVDAGAGFVWPFFNYGRIRNNIRVQDARLQQALVTYRETVIQAAREVEDAMTGYLGATEQSAILAQSVASAERSNEISMLRYREGFSDYQRVLDSQEALFREQRRYVDSLGTAVLAVVDLYKALGGGWEIHGGRYEVSPESREQMEQRTGWGRYFEETAESSHGEGDSE